MRVARVLSLLVLLSLLFSSPVLALDSMEFSSYDIKMVVKDDNSYQVTETINTTFFEKRHGIIRSIPLRTYRGKKAYVTNVSVLGQEFSASKENGNLIIKIGEENSFAKANEEYVISYNYSIMDDGLRDMDELYFNLIGSQWDNYINNVTFSIKMPYEYDTSKVNFTYGKINSTNNSKVKFDAYGTIITGSLKTSLSPNEALTVAIPLPQGYFINAQINNKIAYIIKDFYWMIFAFLAFTGYVLWVAIKKNRRIFPTVEFYPPKGLTSADVGYIIDGRVEAFDLTSLIIYWADKGYLSITEESIERLLEPIQAFTFTKLREMGPDAKDYEIYMFDDLFTRHGDGTTVRTDMLEDSFYKTIDYTKFLLRREYNKDPKKRVYKKGDFLTSIFIQIPSLLIFMFLMILISDNTQIIEHQDSLFIVFGEAMILTFILNFFISTFTRWNSILKSNKIVAVLGRGLLALLGCGFVLYFGIEAGVLTQAIFGLTLAAIPITLATKEHHRTELGNEYVERLLGFKAFLESAEKDRINMLVEENPQYFYNVLPFAMVLGVTDKWARNFEKIALSQPSWYYSNQHLAFNVVLFSSILNNNLDHITQSTTSQPSQFSGGSSFGGSAGGGSGGGGGGSW